MLLVLDSFYKLIFDPWKSKFTTKDQDPLLQLVNLSLNSETHTFLNDIIFLALLSSDPTSILDRFMVQRVKHCTDRRAGPAQELLIFEVMDTHRSGSKPFCICLKRIVTVHPPPPSYFTDHPDSATVLENIMQTLKEKIATPSTSVSSSNGFSPSLRDPSSDQHSISYQRIDKSETLPPSPNLSPFDAATSKATKAVHISMPSTSKVYKADDRFIGERNIGDYAPWIHNITLILPESLSLFEMAVLADAVHNHDSLYSTMRNQGYWFASTICDVISKEYTCTEVTRTKHTISRDDICIPPNNYFPHLAGRWMRISVNRVKEAVSSVIASNFRKYLQEKREEVRFILSREPYLLKPRYRC
jgi:hypothetical protein